MKNIFKTTAIAFALLAIGVTSLTSCKNELYDTQQFKGGVNLNVFGPCPVARGGELRFIGSGLDQINSIELPGCDAITDIQRISSQEIRITVPQTAEEGKIVLNYSGGQIITKTPISYSEPISIEELSPARIKPGEKLSIKGEYLNLMSEVCFSFLDGRDSVNVFIDEFITHERNLIEVIVPEEAVSGVVAVSDAAELPQMIKSSMELDVVLPAVERPLDLTDAVPGSAVKVKGTDLDLVRSVLMPDGSEVEFTYNEAESSITFTLPYSVSDGAIVAVPASGVKVAIANIGVVIPTELKATPSEGIRGGDEIVVKGVNMDQVASVTVPNAGDVALSSSSPTEIRFSYPAAGQSGEVMLNLYSGKQVSIVLTTAKPEVQAFNPSPVSAASQFKMVGRNLDLVTKVTFTGGISVDVTPTSATEITLTADPNAQSGPLTLTMANGETATTPDLIIQAPECCFITQVLTETLIAGELMEAEVVNGNKLSNVLVNGNACQYIINGSRLLINLPSDCGGKSTITLVSTNGSIDYVYDIIGSAHQSIVVWDEPIDFGNWNGNYLRIYKEQIENVPAGATMVFHLAAYAFTQIQINNANWSQYTILETADIVETLTFDLTADVLQDARATDDGWSTTAFVVQGAGTVVNKVTIEYDLQ